MKGREFLNEKDEITRGGKKKPVKKISSKKADHKHSYTIKKIIQDSWGLNLSWQTVYLICDVCGKEKRTTESTFGD